MSYLTVQPFVRVYDQWMLPDRDVTPVKEKIVHPIITGKRNNLATRYQADFYKKIALDIVTETVYHYPYPCITEKTLRPIACKRMFIIVGPPGVLQLLHKKNFQTFGDVIDESYDREHDPVLRWKKLEQCILEFTNQSLDCVKKIIIKKIPVLEHNYQTLLNLERTELENL